MYRFSAAGKHHGYDDNNDQDALIFKENESFCVMVLADGVSTCEKAKRGADVTCNSTADFMLEHAYELFLTDKGEAADMLTMNILEKLSIEASADNRDIEEYSSTVAAILFDRINDRMFYFNIGDGLIIAVKNNKCCIVAMPMDSRNGCLVTTSFDAAAKAKTGIVDTTDTHSVMICSDGAWHLIYHRNRMLQSIKEMILSRDYDRLKETFLEKERYDDCSFIIMDKKDHLRRRTA